MTDNIFEKMAQEQADYQHATDPSQYEPGQVIDTPPPHYEVISVTDPAIIQADSSHAVMERLLRENSALKARVEKYEAPPPVFSAPVGGPPVPHHLHLVDGRIISNHDGIGTHYSEVLPDGRERITRIVAHYPVNEVTPSVKFA